MHVINNDNMQRDAAIVDCQTRVELLESQLVQKTQEIKELQN